MIFLSFKYNPDVWRAIQLRRKHVELRFFSTEYWNNSIYERSITNRESIKSIIRKELNDTIVTVILVTSKTRESNYVKYAYVKSIERNNGILQLDVSDIEDQHGRFEKFISWLPYIRKGLRRKWYSKCPLKDWIEEASTINYERKKKSYWV